MNIFLADIGDIAEDFMKIFCISLRKHVADAVNFEKRKTLPLPEKETKSQHNVSFVEINSHKNLLKIKITETLQTIVILLVYTEVQHIIFVT